MGVRDIENRNREEVMQHFTVNGREITASFAAEPNPEAHRRIRDIMWSVFFSGKAGLLPECAQ